MPGQPPIVKYLADYAEPEAAGIRLDRQYDHVVVIPACAEDLAQLEQVWRRINGSYLVILVLNCPDDSPKMSRRTEALAVDMVRHREVRALSDRAQLLTGAGPDLLLVDRFSPDNRIPSRQGVGLARKIGCDIALALIHNQTVTDRWIFTTDADVILPSAYFLVPQPLCDTSAALVFPFRHVATADLDQASRLYELSMLYHAAGLRWAGSDYAYTTIGSTIAFSASHYAGVRGFPRRSTGEDFYLLNKLRKSGPVTCLPEPGIVIAGRISDRVPVGTGPAIARIAEMTDPANEFRVAHPGCYEQLRHTLRWMEHLSVSQPADARSHDSQADSLLEQAGFFDHYERKRRQSPGHSVMRKHIHDWFDALKTRQFIHRLRDRHYGRIPVSELGQAPFLATGASVETLRRACFSQVFDS